MTSSLIHETESSTDPGVKPSAQTIRLDRAAALVAIAGLIVENNLPAPHGVWFQPAATVASPDLAFDSAEAAEAWASFLGLPVHEQVYTPEGKDAPIRLVNAYGPWNDSEIRVAGSTTVTVAADETTAAVTA